MNTSFLKKLGLLKKNDGTWTGLKSSKSDTYIDSYCISSKYYWNKMKDFDCILKSCFLNLSLITIQLLKW